jgi:hypothetical protein
MPIQWPNKSLLPKGNIKKGNERQFDNNWNNTFNKKDKKSLTNTDDTIDSDNYPEEDR